MLILHAYFIDQITTFQHWLVDYQTKIELWGYDLHTAAQYLWSFQCKIYHQRQVKMHAFDNGCSDKDITI